MGRTTLYANAIQFAANEASLVRAPGRQIDWAQVPESFKSNGTSYTITVNDASVAETDTTLTVEALPVAIPVGTVLDFGVHSVDSVQMLAKVSAYAAAGATSLTVEPLGHEIEDDATATYVVYPAYARKQIPAGTVMANLSGGKMIPRSAVTGSETSTSLLESTAVEDEEADNHDVGHGVIVGGAIFENLLPDWDGGSSGDWTDTYKGELETAGVGIGWVWESYSDSTS